MNGIQNIWKYKQLAFAVLLLLVCTKLVLLHCIKQARFQQAFNIKVVITRYLVQYWQISSSHFLLFFCFTCLKAREENCKVWEIRKNFPRLHLASCVINYLLYFIEHISLYCLYILLKQKTICISEIRSSNFGKFLVLREWIFWVIQGVLRMHLLFSVQKERGGSELPVILVVKSHFHLIGTLKRYHNNYHDVISNKFCQVILPQTPSRYINTSSTQVRCKLLESEVIIKLILRNFYHLHATFFG